MEAEGNYNKTFLALLTVLIGTQSVCNNWHVHSPQNESKVLAAYHVSDVPDWCTQRQQPVSFNGKLHWRNVPERSRV